MTRYGQIKFITENKEKQLMATAENFKKDATRELRLKFEIESKRKKHKKNFLISNFLKAFLENRAEYYEELSCQWNERYEKEVKQLDEQINQTKDVMIALKLKYDEMAEQFSNREEEIQDYLEEKKVKDDAANEAEKKYEAIVRIQSWWKGIMVRRCLGPYRRKKHAKKNKKTKGGKKK